MWPGIINCINVQQRPAIAEEARNGSGSWLSMSRVSWFTKQACRIQLWSGNTPSWEIVLPCFPALGGLCWSSKMHRDVQFKHCTSGRIWMVMRALDKSNNKDQKPRKHDFLWKIGQIGALIWRKEDWSGM